MTFWTQTLQLRVDALAFLAPINARFSAVFSGWRIGVTSQNEGCGVETCRFHFIYLVLIMQFI